MADDRNQFFFQCFTLDKLHLVKCHIVSVVQEISAESSFIRGEIP